MILDANQNSFNALLPNRFCGHGCVEAVIAAFRKNDISLEGMYHHAALLWRCI